MISQKFGTRSKRNAAFITENITTESSIPKISFIDQYKFLQNRIVLGFRLWQMRMNPDDEQNLIWPSFVNFNPVQIGLSNLRAPSSFLLKNVFPN